MWLSTQICVGTPVTPPQLVEQAPAAPRYFDRVDRRIEADQRVARSQRQPPIDEQRDARADRRSDDSGCKRDDNVPGSPSVVRAWSDV